MKKINIALEWFLNPDHLPIIVGAQKQEYRKTEISSIYKYLNFQIKNILSHMI